VPLSPRSRRSKLRASGAELNAKPIAGLEAVGSAEEEAAAQREHRRALQAARAGCVPELDGRGLTDGEFDLCPEKLEYYGDPPRLGNPAQSLDLLRLLLVNWGLREAVKLAPKAVWQQALDESKDAPDGR
jgi:hypothetical protein